MRDPIERQAAIDAADEIIARDESGNNDVVKALRAWKAYIKALPSAQPERCEDYANFSKTRLLIPQPNIIRCKDCIYYDPPHVENNDVRYEYAEMPVDAFDVLGTGLVTTEYGINIGGRCCRDYNAGYEDDKRIYVPENNYCGRAERRTDDSV